MPCKHLVILLLHHCVMFPATTNSSMMQSQPGMITFLWWSRVVKAVMYLLGVRGVCLFVCGVIIWIWSFLIHRSNASKMCIDTQLSFRVLQSHAIQYLNDTLRWLADDVLTLPFRIGSIYMRVCQSLLSVFTNYSIQRYGLDRLNANETTRVLLTPFEG